ncbi:MULTISPECIES: S9 family peptidase [unclassified Frankia]|uniref:alpha/beta hydrolase family protein n=1 Tax=unclassified Frankia TaxID=2632575 RepID=UPI0019313E71|nr:MULTISPECIES: alpha/beta hydrolase [unclassified Frankia]MBL7617918.1 alpha/beta hydrolase [Frankia sp. AgB1.8]
MVVVPYGRHPEQTAEVTLPVTMAGPVPLVLLFHGGFWRHAFDRDHVRPIATALAAHGYAVANIEYRRVGGGGGWPNTLVDAATATDTLPTLLGSLNTAGGIGPVIAVGHSAGGHLALWSALRARIPRDAPGWRLTAPDLAGVVALAGVVDLSEAYRLGNGNGAVADFLGGGPQDVPDRYAGADPMLIGAGSVPVTLVHGDRDEALPIAMSRTYANRFGANLVEASNAGHFDLITPETAAWPLALDALAGIRALG